MKKKQVLALMLSATVVSGNVMIAGAADQAGTTATVQTVQEAAAEPAAQTKEAAQEPALEVTAESKTEATETAVASSKEEANTQEAAQKAATESTKEETSDSAQNTPASTETVENKEETVAETSASKAPAANITATSSNKAADNSTVAVQNSTESEENSEEDDKHYTEMPDGSLVPDEGWMFDENGNCVPIPEEGESGTEEDNTDEEKGPVLQVGESFEVADQQHTMKYKVIADGKVELYEMIADKPDQAPANMTISGKVTYKGNTYQVSKVSDVSVAVVWHTQNLTIGEGVEDLNVALYQFRLDTLSLPASLNHIFGQETETDANGDVCIKPFYDDRYGQRIDKFILSEDNPIFVLEDGNIRLRSEAEQEVQIGDELEKEYIQYVVTRENEVEVTGAFAGKSDTLTIPATVHIKGRDFKVKAVQATFKVPLGSIKHLVIEEGVEAFRQHLNGGASTSNHNYGLETITLPSTLKEYDAFSAKDLKRIDVAEGNPNYKSVDGVLYNKEMTELITLPASADMEEYTTPDSVTKVLGIAMDYIKTIKKITIADSVKTLELGAVASTTGLEELVIGSGIEEMGDVVVRDCYGLKKLTIEASCRYSAESFSHCPDLEEVYIEGTPTAFGGKVLTDLPSLKAFHVSNSDTLFSKDGVLYGYKGTGGSVISKYPANKAGDTFILSEDVKGFDAYAFHKTQNLGTLVIPAGVQLRAGTVYDPAKPIKVYLGDSSLNTEDSSPLFVSDDAEKITVCVNNQAFADELNSNGRLYGNVEAVVETIPATSLSVDKESVSLKPGEETTIQTSYEPYYATDQITWKSNDEAVATVENGKIKAVGFGTTTIDVTMGGQTASVEVTVRLPLESIALDQSEMTLNKGDSTTLNVTYNPDNTTDSKEITWESSNTKVATVDKDGNVTAVGAGTATITANGANNTKATCEVTVKVPMTGMTINHKELTLNKGDSEKLKVTITPADTTDDTTVEWSSSNTNAVTVSQDGTVTAVGNGDAQIMGYCNGFQVFCNVTVKVPMTGFELEETELTMNLNDTRFLNAIWKPTDTTDNTAVTWSSSNEKAVTVNENGFLMAVGAGTATIKAECNGFEATCKVTVKNPLLGLSIDGDIYTYYLEEGQDVDLDVTYYPEDTTDSKDVTWSSSNPDIASVDENGKITAKKAGEATITVTHESGLTDSRDVVVTQKEVPLDSISLDQTTLNLDVDADATLNVIYNPDNTTVDRTAEWTSSNPEVAFVDGTGKVFGRSEGTAVITATVDGKTASCTVTVTKPEIPLDAINFGDRNMVQMTEGETDKLTVYYAPENTTVDRTITWTSSNPNVATAEGDGTLTAHGEGVTIITATVAGKSASIRVVVYAKATIVESVTLDHQSMDLTVGNLAKLTATVKQSGGDAVSVNWSSSDPSIVQVDSFGNIKAIGEGTATITASAQDKSASCVVTVKKKEVVVTDLTIDKDKLTLEAGTTGKVTAKATNSDGTEAKVTYASSDTSIATVDADGTIHALKEGTVNITASAGDLTVVCHVTVTPETEDPDTPPVDPENPTDPDGGNQGGNENPGGGDNAGDNGNENPGGGDNTGDNGNENPGSGDNTENGDNQNPDGGDSTGDNGNENPGAGDNTGNEDNQNPDGGDQNGSSSGEDNTSDGSQGSDQDNGNNASDNGSSADSGKDANTADQDSNGSTNENNNQSESAPKTGDPASLGLLASLTALSGGVIAKLRRKKK